MLGKLLKPFMAIMSRSKYKQKFLLISLLFVVPLVYLGLSWFALKNEEIKDLNNEQAGLEQLAQIWPLVLQVQQHRGTANGYLNGNTESLTQLEAKGKEISDNIAAIEAKFDASEYPDAYEAWKETSKAWKTLDAQYTGMEAPVSFQAHSAVISNIINVIKLVADESTLTLDTDITSYYMMDLLVNDLPQLVEYTAIIRGKGNGALAGGNLTPAVASELSVQRQVAGETIEAVNNSLKRFASMNSEEYGELVEKLTNIGVLANNYLIVLNREILEAEKLKMSADDYFAQGTAAITEMNELISELKVSLAGDLQDRESALKTELTITCIILLIVALIIVFMYIAFYRNVIDAVNELKLRSQEMASGDFSQPVELQTRDELSEVGAAFNDMQGAISAVLNSNQHMASTVLEASNGLASVARESAEAMRQVAESVQVVSDGTSNQKRTTGESSTAMNEMAVGVNRIAEAASEVAFVAIRTNEQAMIGNEQLDSSVQQMDMIKQSQQRSADIVARLDQYSQQIGKITTLIMEISSQTKLLSLNASIEAARAGEHGLGFAVVAKEVGSLAEQSTKSSAEISKLLAGVSGIIHENVEAMNAMAKETDAGIQSIHRSKETLDHIMNDIRLVTEQIQEVSATSEQMSAEMQQVTASITEIAVISEQSANEAETMAAATEEQLAATEQIQGSAQSLQELSLQLQSELSKFVLRS